MFPCSMSIYNGSNEPIEKVKSKTKEYKFSEVKLHTGEKIVAVKTATMYVLLVSIEFLIIDL